MPSYYITPQTTITVCRNVPWDNTYRHSIRPSSLANQLSQISAYAVSGLTFNNQTYQRINDNVVRLQIGADQIRDCNYLIINNGAGFPQNKTYYAFINSVEYINNNTCEISYELDYLQTYYFDFDFDYVFVEREHSASDSVGLNTVPESFELGELICHYKSGKYYLSSQGTYTVIMYTPNLDESTPFVNWTGSIPIAVDKDSVDQSQFMPLLRNKFGGVVCALVIPISYTNITGTMLSIMGVQGSIAVLQSVNASIISVFQINGEIYSDNFSNSSITIRDFNVNEQNAFRRLDGTMYSNIKNKKLLQYPFKRLVVSNNNGTNAEYKWEEFTTRSGNNVQAQFSYFNMLMPDPHAYIYPNHYRGLDIDYESGVMLEDFPRPCWTEDSYTQWWAQNKSNFGMTMASNVISAGIMVATGGMSAAGKAANFANVGSEALVNMAAANMQGKTALGWSFNRQASSAFESEAAARKSGAVAQGVGLAQGAHGIGSSLAQLQQAKATPDQTTVQDNSALVKYNQDRLGWTFYDIGVNGEMAEVIDNYFTMFGYATHKVKIPLVKDPNTVNTRAAYNYTKTQNCCLKSASGLPSEAQSVLEKIFDTGITLWARASEVGDYTVNNQV